jgi:hypothetical protein
MEGQIISERFIDICITLSFGRKPDIIKLGNLERVLMWSGLRKGNTGWCSTLVLVEEGGQKAGVSHSHGWRHPTTVKQQGRGWGLENPHSMTLLS